MPRLFLTTSRAPLVIFVDRHASLQRRQNKRVPHRLRRHPPGKPGATKIDRPPLMDAAIDRPVRGDGIKRILRRTENQSFAGIEVDGDRFFPKRGMVANGSGTCN